MKVKKKLAGLMAVAVTATTLPGSIFSVPGTVEAATEITGLPTAKYEMDFDDNLNVTGASGVTSTAQVKGRTEYQENVTYSEGRRGSALDTKGEYGIVFGDVELDGTYTISTWVYMKSQPGNFSPIVVVAHPGISEDWLAMAGALQSPNYILWCEGQDLTGDLGTAPLKLNQWVNYTLTVDGTTATLYENGKQVIKDTDDAVPTDSEKKEIEIGVNYWDPTPDCLYDDMKIYDEVLSAEQVEALYGGTAVAINAPAQNVRVNKTMEMDADVISSEDDIKIEWSSNSDCLTVDSNGVVTGQTEGTATITAKVMNGEDELASDSMDITVLPERGKLIADFTFDSWEEGFQGAGATAAQIYPDGGNIKLTSVENRGSVLEFTEPQGDDNDGLSITNDEGTGVLDGVKEFTVSYDSFSNGGWFDAWVFYADGKGDTSTNSYISIREESQTAIKAGRSGEDFSVDSGSAGAWKHVDVVFGQHKTEIYVNGQMMGSCENNVTPIECIGNETDVRIGDSNFAGESWIGMLDNFKIYDYALTAEEIASTPVSSVTVSSVSGADTVYAGNTLQLNAQTAPENATDKSVEWTSSDPEVATVDSTGLVTTKTAGSVTITATAKDKDGKSGSLDITVKEALTHHERVEATCVNAGNIEYWSDGEGNKYSDAEGTQPVSDVTIPATGHDYISSGKWKATDDGYSIDVTFTCKKGDDTATVSPQVTSTQKDRVTIYTAVAEYNGKQFTYTYEVQDRYTLTVVNGKIAGVDVTTNQYGYNDVVTVVADEEKDGQYFAGWYIGDTLVSSKATYTFCIAEDKTLTAKYEDKKTEEKAAVSMRMSDREDIGSGAERVVATVEWSVPSDYTMVGAGLVRSYTENAEDMLTLDKVDGSSIRQNKTTAWCKNGSYKLTVNMSPTTKLNSLYARGYLIYEDAEGVEHTIYTDVFESPATSQN